MKIDNSQMQAFWFCPLKWRERYENNLELRTRDSSSLDFGTRMHQLLEERHKGEKQGFKPLKDEVLEAEAQLTFEAYCAYWGSEEPFEVVDVERYFEVPVGRCSECAWGPKEMLLPIESCEKHYGPMAQGALGRHIYNGEFDGVVRMKDSSKLQLLETKTERRGGKSNLPEGWISKSQVGLYQWAAEQIYGEPFEGILLNVITRQSPKGECQPTFRRDNLYRTGEQQLDAVRNLVWVADQIEEMQRSGFYPSDKNNCVSPIGWKCDYFDLHVTPEGRPVDELVKIKYKEAEEYLSGL